MSMGASRFGDWGSELEVTLPDGKPLAGTPKPPEDDTPPDAAYYQSLKGAKPAEPAT